MPFNDRENSIEDGKPIRCFLFRRGSLVYAYTTADRNQTVNNIVFSAGYQISDDGSRASGQTSASTKQVTINADSAISRVFRQLAPNDATSLTVWDKHADDTDYVVSWVGAVNDVRWPDIITCQLTCQSLSASFARPGLRRSWQLPCSNVLYDIDCRVVQALYAVPVTVDSLTGASANVIGLDPAATPSGWFSGGLAIWTNIDGSQDSRSIAAHTGNTVTFLGGTVGMLPGLALDLFPGCDQTAQTCASKFNNMDNFGGQPHLPGRSPFDGNPVF